jgi:hypothetical protein
MNYLDAFESELRQAGIPARRRARILAEFADHLHENPEAELGAPRDLARQFRDELGTRLARQTALWAFAVLTVAAVLLVEAFFDGGRLWAGWVGYGHYPHTYAPTWYIVLLAVCAVSAQVALAAGVLALARAFRLRNAPVICAAEARVLNRRAAVGLIAGAITMLILPLSQVRLGGYSYAWWMHPGIGIAAIVMLLVPLPGVLRAARLRPEREGEAGDLARDLGVRGTSATPWHAALILSGAIVVFVALIGVGSDDPIDGVVRGLLDGAACMIGFTVLGTYLGLRTTS